MLEKHIRDRLNGMMNYIRLTIGLVFVISGVANIYAAATNPEEYRGFADTALIQIYRDLIDSVSTSLMPIMLAAVGVYEAVLGALLFGRGVLVKIGLLMGIVFALAISMLGTEELAALALIPIFAAMFLGDNERSLLQSFRPKPGVVSAN
jgi:hypothetical protein